MLWEPNESVVKVMKWYHRNGGTRHCVHLRCFFGLLDVGYNTVLPSESFLLYHRTASVPLWLSNVWFALSGDLARLNCWSHFLLTLEVYNLYWIARIPVPFGNNYSRITRIHVITYTNSFGYGTKWAFTNICWLVGMYTTMFPPKGGTGGLPPLS